MFKKMAHTEKPEPTQPAAGQCWQDVFSQKSHSKYKKRHFGILFQNFYLGTLVDFVYKLQSKKMGTLQGHIGK